ncbi:hypothetical protein [Salinibacterium sp. ZJ450]|uniref:hypothetical protein n=1 Tax=Salinibacterium sp. ZJ450 TaxID=2708338 RepID=UPI001CD5A829|nr:hypothetical protein [Salinibacterium sp. ZJ450]
MIQDVARDGGGRLPFVDEHMIRIDASRALVWAALRSHVESSLNLRDRHPLAWILGTEPRSGFAVDAAVPSELMRLIGRHRFSRYALTFVLSGTPKGPTLLRAQSCAAVPGLYGRMYRLAVIGTGCHRLATRHILRAIERKTRRLDLREVARAAKLLSEELDDADTS